MGLFGSNTITSVGTQVMRVLEDKSIPDSVATGVSKNLFNDDDQMVDYVLEELSQSIGLRAQRMINYGRNGYLYGLPKSTLKTSSSAKTAVQSVLNTLAGAPVSLEYYHFGRFNNLHYGWQHLVEAYGYNSATNQLTVDGKAVYLKNMQAIVTDATLAELANGSMEQWGESPSSGYRPQMAFDVSMLASVIQPTPFSVDPAAAHDYLLVTYCWEETNEATSKTTVKTAQLQFNVGEYDVQADYHQASYMSGGKRHYWTYKDRAGTNPSIDAAFETAYSEGGTFFPITYFRYAKQTPLTDKTSEWFKSSEKLCNYLKLDFEQVAQGVQDNPDIDQVEQAMMMMAVPANTENQLERRYLFDFFSDIYNAMTAGATQPNQAPVVSSSLNAFLAASTLVLEHDNSTFIIQDKRFKMALSYQTVVKRLVAGKKATKGKYGSEYVKSPKSVSVNVLSGGKTTWVNQTHYHSYYHQVTEDVYEEILVYNLSVKYWIFEGYITTGDEEDEILMIPIDEAITKHYSIPDKEELYGRSMHYIFNSRVVTKLKWYQTGLFKFLIFAIAIVMVVYTYGSSLKAAFLVMAAEGITYALIQAIVYKLIVGLIVNYAIKIFIKIVGVKFAFLTAIMIAIAAIYQISTGNLSGLLPAGEQLLATSATISKMVVNEVSEDLQDLMGEQQEFLDYTKVKDKALEDAKSLLDNGLRVNPVIILGETPTEFYQRTVHSGNIGTLGIDIVSNYVDYALQLPKLSETIGDF